MATARDLQGERHKVVAIVGDGALTCGLSYEGMNNAGHSDRDIILVVNDNGMSISPNVGAISKTLGRIVADPRTNRLREKIKGMTFALGGVFGEGVVDFAKNVEESVKNLFSPGMLFEELGLPLLRPDRRARPAASSATRSSSCAACTGPRVVHVMTQKGKGFSSPRRTRRSGTGSRPTIRSPARRARRRAARRPGPRCSATGSPRSRTSTPSSSRSPPRCRRAPGTNIFQKKHPERFFDVGIAEGHAVTFAGGLATQGIRPVVAIYSTFLQRAYDNVIHDVAVQQLPVIFCMDRAGLVGEDGQTHMGLYDIAYMLAVPGMTVTAPKDGDELVGLLRTALAHTDGPFCTRYPARQGAGRAAAIRAEIADGAVRHLGAAPAGQRRRRHPRRRARWWRPRCRRRSCSRRTAWTARWSTAASSSRSTPRCWSRWCSAHRILVTVEEGTIVNGFGAYLAETLQTTHPEVRVVALGVPDRLIEQAPRAEQLELFGLTAAGIARRITALQHEESLEAR